MGGIPLTPRYRAIAATRAEPRQFTDREAAFEAFRRALAEQRPDEQKVLNFFGIGGIGKSRLQQELRATLARERSGISVRIDFQPPAVRRQDAGLYQLRHCLRQEHGIQLPLFDIAYAVYWQRTNPKVPLSAGELPLLQESEILSEIVTAAGTAPVVGIVVNLLKGLDLLGRRAQRWRRVREDPDLRGLDRLEVHEILDALTFFFARNLMHALADSGKRCVVMLDAHEALWEDVTARGGRGDRDAWIRDLVIQTPGVLWVVSSRDPLRWVADDPAWAPYLEFHAIGDLSHEDCLAFLRSCGIEGPVAERIAAASNGVPFYLDVSVDHWESIRPQREPRPEDFGRTQADLLSRFVGHVPQAEEELLKVLSVPRSWDRALFELLVRHFNIAFPLSRWSDFCTYSFNRGTSGDRWVMHALMRDELARRLSAETRLEVHVAIHEHERKRSEDPSLAIASRVESFREAVWHGLAADRVTPEWLMHQASLFITRGFWQAVSEVIDELRRVAKGHPVLNAVGDCLDAWVLRQLGCLAEARAAFAAVDMSLLAPFELGIRFQVANVLRETGRTREAGEIYRELWGRTAVPAERELHRLVGIQYADLHYVQGRFPEAKAILDGIAGLSPDEAAKEVAEAKRILGHIDRLCEHPGRGTALYREARELFTRCDDVFGVAMTATNLAESLWPTDHEAALRYSAEAIELNEALGARLEAGKAQTAGALARLAAGDVDGALADARTALAIQSEIGYRSGEAQARLAEALALGAAGRRQQAGAVALGAARLFEDLAAYPTLRLLAAFLIARADPTAADAARAVAERARAETTWLHDPAASERALHAVVDRFVTA
jgi:tetratricopeptide (TPR) repeat protein